jgi:ADP-heptose:LPS heptosyltransferase
MESNPKSILVVQIGKLGDMILTSPLFYELKKLFPRTVLKVLASPVNAEFVSHLKVVDEVILYRKSLFKDLFLAGKLKKENFDLWIDPKEGISRTSASLLKIAKPKLSMGYNLEEKIFDVDLRDFAKGKHAVDLALASVYYFGKELEFVRPVLTDFPNGEPKKWDIIINVSAGDSSRYLHEVKWISLISRMMQKNHSLRIHLIGVKRDAKLIESIYHNFKTELITYNYNYTLPALINALRSGKLIISPDTSIIHIASGLNQPVLGLYPNVPWNFERFKPLSEKYDTIISKSERGISDVTDAEVFEKYEKLIDRISER